MTEDEYSDLIVFVDEDGEVKKWWVKLISADNLVTFKTKPTETSDGNTISIPPSRVIKIKRRGEVTVL